MDIRELLLEEETDMVDAISLVDRPAIEENWQAFSKQNINYTFSNVNKKKKIVIGPAMIPNKLIYRVDRFTGKEYYVWFRKDTIEKIAREYLKEYRQFDTTLDHVNKVKNVYVYESWIVDNPKNDKSNHLGFNVNEGTWMVSMKIDSEDIWRKVESGDIRGFSIEGWFSDKLSEYSEKNLDADDINKILYDENTTDKQKYEKLSILLK